MKEPCHPGWAIRVSGGTFACSLGGGAFGLVELFDRTLERAGDEHGLAHRGFDLTAHDFAQVRLIDADFLGNLTLRLLRSLKP